MKFFWMSFIIVIIIHVTRVKNQLNIFLEYRNIRDLSKASKLPSYVIVKRRTIGLFPELPHWGNRFVVDLKPPKETYSQENNPEQYKKMRELSIKDINCKGKYMIKADVTTRRPLMRTKRFTVRPHDVYRQSYREKYNWNSKRRNINKSRTPKKSTTVGKTIYETKNESRFLSFKNFAVSLNYKDYNIPEKQNKNSYVTPDSRKLHITLLLPKTNDIKYFKENPEQSVSKQFQINNFVSEIEVSFDIVNDSYRSLIEEKENVKVSSNAIIKSRSKDQIDEVIEPENNLYDQDELIPVRFTDISFLEPDFAGDDAITDSDIEYLVSRPKRSVNIIEEEGIATTFSGIKVTNQDLPITHDLTFKNIHT